MSDIAEIKGLFEGFEKIEDVDGYRLKIENKFTSLDGMLKIF